eukprot:m.637018 g.637018  ORF g.637018 m.637018 type:complete len:314 (+) comp22600_c0_seq13:322-1263(+)
MHAGQCQACMLRHRLSPAGVLINKISNGKNVLRVQLVFDATKNADSARGDGCLQPRLPGLSDAMMMGNTSSVSNHLIACLHFHRVERGHGILESRMQEAKVEVDADASVVQLRHTTRRVRFSLHPLLCAHAIDGVLHVATQILHTRMRARCLERLGNVTVIKRNVSDVCDDECQQISPFSIFLATLDAVVASSNFIDDLLLAIDHVLFSLEQQRGHTQILLAKALDASNIECLDLVNKLCDNRVLFGLHRSSKLKLLVVNETNRSRLGLFLRDLGETGYTITKVGEHDRPVHDHGWHVLDLHRHFRHYAKCAF